VEEDRNFNLCQQNLKGARKLSRNLTAPRGERLSLRLVSSALDIAWRQIHPEQRRSSRAFNRKHRKAGDNLVAEVKLGDNETLESALRRFKRKVQQEDIIREVKRHAFYVPPGEKRRLKSALARKRNRKKFRRYIIE
jgi:small subunit ribosomal protein S21